MTEPRTSSVDPNLVCYLTKRKFRTAEELKRHEDFSQLYIDTYNNVVLERFQFDSRISLMSFQILD